MQVIPCIKSNSGRYKLMYNRHNKRKGIFAVVFGFIFFSFIIPCFLAYAMWRPTVLFHSFQKQQSTNIFLSYLVVIWMLFNIKIFEELIYCRKLLVLSAIALDICMIPTTVLPFSGLFDFINICYRLYYGYPLLSSTRKIYGLLICVMSIIMNYIGFYRGTHIETERYTIRSRKLNNSKVKFVHISDVHIGSRLDKLPSKMIDKIIQEKPDFVVITGDLIDSHNVISTDLSPFMKFKERNIPVYFTIGNHDIMSGEEYVTCILRLYGIDFIKNNVFCKQFHGENIQLVGIDDVQKNNISKENYSVLLHHRPHGYKRTLQSNRVDLQLAGHTHNGQLFPFNLVIKLFHRKACGMYNIKNKTNSLKLYTHPGSGAWGPHFRTASKNLITVFTIEPDFNNKSL
ncbi:Calcineurin-like phosphoesterase domain-containing protein [Entamoeba marina]